MMANEGWTAQGISIAGYRIEVAGDASTRDVWLSYEPTRRLDLSTQERHAAEDHWQARLAGGQRIHDRPLYRLLRWAVRGRRLVLETGLTSYKEFLGTSADRGSAPLALSAVSVTSDSHAILNLRAPAVAELSGLWHVTPAGHLHPPATVSSAAWAELSEELAVERREVDRDSLRATGLVVNTATGKPEVTLALRLTLTAGEVLARTAKDNWEYTRLEPLEWSAGAVEQWLTANVDRCVPVGHAALLLAGRLDFSDAWFEREVRLLTS